jgi:sugar phosphate isomerase/epimerase
MPAPIALQLYTVRELLAKDFSGVVTQIAGMGYAGVETAGLYGASPSDARSLFDSLGLTVCSAHMPLPLGDKKNEVLDTLAALGCKYFALGGTPRDLRTADQVRRACDTFNAAQAVAAEHGLTFALHTHWWEFEKIEDGRTVFQALLDELDPRVQLELDVYWAQTAGADPAALVRALGRRTPLLHIKDGPCIVGQPMVAVGDGRLDFTAIVQASAETAQWLIVELDECAGDMLAAVRKSHQYLVGKGLARGK